MPDSDGHTIVKNPPSLPGLRVGECLVKVFDSLSEFADVAEANRDPKKTSSAPSDSKWSPGWHGSESFEEACSLAREGWTESIPDIEANLAENAEAFTAASPTMDVAGSMVDMGLFMGGEPEHMVNYIPNTGSAPVISIVTPFSFNSGVDSDAVKRYGVAMVGAIESLRRQGTTVELFAVSEIHGRDERVALEVVRLCDSRTAYVPDQVVFGVGHPSMLRRLEFGVMEGWGSSKQSEFGVGGGYGSALQKIDIPAILGLPEDTVVFPKLGGKENEMDQEEFNEYVQNIINGKEKEDSYDY